MDMSAINDLVAKAVETEDQSVEVTHTFNDDPIEAGLTVGRLIEYIEFGNHKQPDYQGKAKPDAPVVRITFELLHPVKNIKEYEVDGVTQRHGQMISVQISKKLSDKAKFKKLFNKLTYGRDIKHIAQMLGEPFLINVYHNVTKKDGKDVTYVNLDKDGDYGIGAPFSVDPMTQQKTTYDIGQPTRPIRLFLWDNPTQETWDALFIDGTREKKHADGTVEQVSKNWMQERILSATNFGGSALQQMLGGIDGLPTEEPVDPISGLPATDGGLPEQTGSDADEMPIQTTQPPAEKQETVQTTTAPASTGAASDDALAALGLATS